MMKGRLATVMIKTAYFIRPVLAASLVSLVLGSSSTSNWTEDSNSSPHLAAELYARLSLAYLAQGQTKLAFKRLQQGLTLYQNNGQIQLALAMYKNHEQQWQASEQAFKRAFAIQPSSQIAFNFDHYLSQRKRCKQALPYLEQAGKDVDYAKHKSAQIMANQCKVRLFTNQITNNNKVSKTKIAG